MKKKRMNTPYEFVWEDEEGMLHICNYSSCKDGCECEKMMMSKEFLAEYLRKYGNTSNK